MFSLLGHRPLCERAWAVIHHARSRHSALCRPIVMALDVRLSRDVDEPWGFEIFGGVDDDMPLTIEKIEADSPAKRAGLLNGDNILTINGEEAIDMSVEVATRRVEESGHSLTVGVLRGLYDPVLDDTEPLCYDYEEILGRQSEPTEVVFQIQQFVEPSDIGSHLIDFGSSQGLTESRSLTASPFVTPTKPYRPFSTEPIVEVPPLEDPIILNPNYRDEFAKSPIDNDPDYLINAFGKHELGESKYKLPISEQYDPDGTRFKQNVEVTEKLLKYEKHVKSLSKDLEVVDVTKETKLVDSVTGEALSKDVRRESMKGDVKVEKKGVRISEEVTKHEESMRKESKSMEITEIFREEVEEKLIREELQYIEKMRQDMDLEKIEETAMAVVEESIERAVSVAEEIKKVINEEMSSSEVKQKSESEQIQKSVKSEKTQESSEIIDKTESKEYAERKMSKEERIETQVDGSQKVERKNVKESEISEKVTKDGKDVHRKSLISEEYQHEEVREESRRRESSTQEGKLDVKAKFKKAAKIAASSVKGEKSSAEQRAYTMGLQTIPNIRGTAVHSSYHYDLLLRTFFLHLTDVMVALSRFLLSQPAFNQLERSSVSETRMYESGDSKVRKSSQEVIEKVEKKQEATMKVTESKQERRQLVTPVPAEKKQEMKSCSQKIQKDMKVESVQETKVEKKEVVRPVPVKEAEQEVKVEKIEVKQEQKVEKAVTGAQMAQRSDKRLTPDMTQKLDAVISEFQTVAVEDVKRRSRSRSKIEEEVMKESDPLEWLDKVDSRRTSMERSEMSKKELSSSKTMEKKSSVETEQETKYKKPKTPQQTYIAIVESHVYTNKDAIFEQCVADLSETSSVQSAEEINTAVETIETISAENVAIENDIKELETAKIVNESHKLASVTAESAATVQKIEEVLHDTKELVQEEFKKETAIQSTDIQEVVIQETKEIVEPIVEIKEKKIEKVEKVAIDINESLSVAESAEVTVQESKSEFTNFEMKKETVAIVEEERAVEKIVEIKPEVVEPKPIEVVEITETIKIKPKEEKPIHEEFAALKIVKRVEIDANLSPEIIEVEDISELISKTAVSKVQVGNQVTIDASKELSEKSYVSTQIGQSEANQKSSVDLSQASHMSVSSEIGATSQAKRDSVADVSQTSQVSSQIAASAVKKEMAVSQQVESLSKSSEAALQEASFTAKSQDRKLSLRTDLERQLSTQSPPSTIDTPTPSTVPPTPLTDEYMFKLSTLLPKSRSGTPVPRDGTLSPEEEDPHIVKKHLVPHIETTIERVVYDPPLPTPTSETPQSPVYTKPVLNGGACKVRPVYSKPGLKGGTGRVWFPVYRKPGLFGGADKPEYSKEEIREIERKSSLLASAIDETIKSIEEYKEEVGIDTKKEVKIQEFKEEKITKSYLKESYNKEVRKGSIENGFEEIDTKIEEIIEKCNALASLENGVANNTNVEESENTGIVTEVEEKESRKASIEIEVKHELGPIIEQESNPKDKTVKFESEVKIVEVENAGDTIVVAERKESLPEDIPQTVEIKPRVRSPPPIAIIPETPVEVKPEPVRTDQVETKEERPDALLGFRPVVFDPENIQRQAGGQYYDTSNVYIQEPPTGTRDPRLSPYLTDTGEQIGTIKGIVDGLDEPVMDPEIAKLLGKPGIPDEEIKPIISGEDDMLREAHVMGLARVLNSHMHRADDPTGELQPIKPMIGSLKDSEVIKALNEEMLRQKEEERKKEEKKWTTFLQKPKRPVPKAKFGYQGWTEDDQVVAEPYKVKIVKQAKPKVAPDYKPEDFETGPLPWEETAVIESSLPPVEPEEPILIPEVPEFLEAVDPLKESEVPDLEDTGIPLPPRREPTPPPLTEEQAPEPETIPEIADKQEVVQEEEKQETEKDFEKEMAEQLVKRVQEMVDPNASLDQQLAQMRAQLAALAQIPEVIQQSLELVTQQLSKMTHQESHEHVTQESYQQEDQQEMPTIQELNEAVEAAQNEAAQNEAQQNEANKATIEEVHKQMEMEQQQGQENMRMTPVMTEEEMRNEKQRKEQERVEHESRLVKHHPTPRVAVAKPKRMFGPLDPDEARAVVLPGGRRWRQQQDVYDEQMIKEMFEKQSEVIKGKAIGINFMKYEKPPVSLEHLRNSEVYKLVHGEDQMPPRKVEMRNPVMCEADYRERCRSMTPAVEKKHPQIPQQFHP